MERKKDGLLPVILTTNFLTLPISLHDPLEYAKNKDAAFFVISRKFSRMKGKIAHLYFKEQLPLISKLIREGKF